MYANVAKWKITMFKGEIIRQLFHFPSLSAIWKYQSVPYRDLQKEMTKQSTTWKCSMVFLSLGLCTEIDQHEIHRVWTITQHSPNKQWTLKETWIVSPKKWTSLNFIGGLRAGLVLSVCFWGTKIWCLSGNCGSSGKNDGLFHMLGYAGTF